MADIDLDDLLAGAADAVKAVETDPDTVAALVAMCERAQEYAVSIAPEDSGDYKDGIVVEQSGGNVYLAFSDWKSHWIEFGTEDTPAFHVRARTETHINALEAGGI